MLPLFKIKVVIFIKFRFYFNLKKAVYILGRRGERRNAGYMYPCMSGFLPFFK